MRPLYITLVALAALPVPTTASAQFPELTCGARIRVHAPAYIAGRIDGRLETQRHDSLKITRSDGSAISVPSAEVTGVQVSRGRSWWLGAARGSLWGAAGGLAVGTAAALGPNGCGTSCTAEEARGHFLATPLRGALLGAGVGALLGAERWTTVSLPPRVTIEPVNRDRIAVVLRF
jgi:hypothetical protein